MPPSPSLHPHIQFLTVSCYADGFQCWSQPHRFPSLMSARVEAAHENSVTLVGEGAKDPRQQPTLGMAFFVSLIPGQYSSSDPILLQVGPISGIIQPSPCFWCCRARHRDHPHPHECRIHHHCTHTLSRTETRVGIQFGLSKGLLRNYQGHLDRKWEQKRGGRTGKGVLFRGPRQPCLWCRCTALRGWTGDLVTVLTASRSP